MHGTNSGERPGIPGGIGFEMVARLEFCFAISDHTVLGLHNMAETKFSVGVQWSTASGEMGGLSLTRVIAKAVDRRWSTCTMDIRAVATTFSRHGENPRLADTVSIRLQGGNVKAHPGWTDRWSR